MSKNTENEIKMLGAFLAICESVEDDYIARSQEPEHFKDTVLLAMSKAGYDDVDFDITERAAEKLDPATRFVAMSDYEKYDELLEELMGKPDYYDLETSGAYLAITEILEQEYDEEDESIKYDDLVKKALAKAGYSDIDVQKANRSIEYYLGDGQDDYDIYSCDTYNKDYDDILEE